MRHRPSDGRGRRVCVTRRFGFALVCHLASCNKFIISIGRELRHRTAIVPGGSLPAQLASRISISLGYRASVICAQSGYTLDV